MRLATRLVSLRGTLGRNHVVVGGKIPRASGSLALDVLTRRSFATGEEGSTSFVSRMKKKMVESFENTKKAAVEKAEDENEERMMNLLMSTPKGQFNILTIRDFYVKMKEEQEARADNFIASRMEEYRQGLEQIKRFITILNGFSPDEQKYPILIDNNSIMRVAKSTKLSNNEIGVFVNGCKSIIEMHRWMMRRKAQGLPIPGRPKLMQEMMLQEVNSKRQRLQGGYLAYLYENKGSPRKKRLQN